MVTCHIVTLEYSGFGSPLYFFNLVLPYLGFGSPLYFFNLVLPYLYYLILFTFLHILCILYCIVSSGLDLFAVWILLLVFCPLLMHPSVQFQLCTVSTACS